MEVAGYRELIGVLAERYPLLMPKEQAAEVLGVSRETLRGYIVSGELPNKGRFIPLPAIAKFLLSSAEKRVIKKNRKLN